MSHDSGVRFEQFVNNDVVYKSLVTMTRCKPWEGGNDKSVVTTTGWKPRKFGNEKYSIAHNFFNFDCNIGILHLKMIVLMTGIQLNKNF